VSGWPARPDGQGARFRAERDERIYALIDAGRTNAQIAALLGINRETVRRKRRDREQRES
jgi:DNA-binding NarL/FixJ family response regulator